MLKTSLPEREWPHFLRSKGFVEENERLASLIRLSIRFFLLHVRKEILHVLAAFRSHFAGQGLGYVIFGQGSP
jgi:hypothetical protein